MGIAMNDRNHQNRPLNDADESKLSGDAAAHFAAHETVRHSAGVDVRDASVLWNEMVSQFAR